MQHKIENKRELSDREVLEKVRLVFVKRKNKNRRYALKDFAIEVGLGEISRTTLFAALFNKVATQETITLLRSYLLTHYKENL